MVQRPIPTMKLELKTETNNEYPPQLVVRTGGCSVTGRKPLNQDAFAVKIPTNIAELKYKGVIATIADGISSSDSSQKASETSVTEFIDNYMDTPTLWSVKMSVGKILKSLNNWLFHHVQQGNASSNTMVAAFTGVVLKSNTSYIFHAGDCRVYLYRDQQLTKLTQDHRRYTSKSQHHLTRALGIDSHLEIDYQSIPIQQGDLFLLSTDGIHDTLTEKQMTVSIYHALSTSICDSESSNLEVTAKYLVDSALDAGSNDNATCLFLSVDALPPASFEECFRDRSEQVTPPVFTNGQRIDHYHIIRVIHSGSRSHIYLAQSELDGKRYVLKMPSQNFSDDVVYLSGFIREGCVGEQVRQRGVMRIYPHSVRSPFLYHICDYVDGVTFRQWMLDHPTPSLSEVRVLGKGAIKAMRVLQRMAVVHRDIKPDNFMVDGDMNVTLIDYGTVQSEGLKEIFGHVKENYPVGDLNYAAPEYLRSNQATLVSDVFSLGVTIYELLSNHLPYKPVNASNSITDNPKNYTPVTVFRTDIPDWFDASLKKACHPISTVRYQVLSEFENDLMNQNQELTQPRDTISLMEKNPLWFWKGFSAILFVFVLLELVLLVC
ncbi:bifunctional protein-serine/threonine kinase/phosphatase [Candidatus Enterovibrio escicola]|uniref:Serine/threonine protein kinase n=1 Tax=Candidatus Enterovibrio escicola TaxID=1927127 RepID=A0A2A5T427_9GAMM|nr:bifunctional protein-serine/threonine kinase/phosphatase [Candidatus Enterovibrio escacola]PCS22925.1 serine/threonine protein kinase [Candidatus Enterovibrio escacola]